jgi:hypothetical protein
MIFFLVLSFFFLLSYRIYLSAFFLGLSIASKLVPVLFIPLIIKKFGWRQGLIYATISGVVTIVLFAFLIDKETILHLLKSINLFFATFEFNASIYYVIRWLGKLIVGFNIIKYAGPFVLITASVIILIFSFRQRKVSNQQFFSTALFIITVWYFLSTIVHPWYISLPVMISIFTAYRFAFVWSYVVIFSYSAYQTIPVSENLWLVAVSYVLMICYALLEMRKRQLPPPSL